jgi:hypothetical protein
MIGKKKTQHKSQQKNAFALVRDVVMIAIGIVIALFLSKIGLIDYVVSLFKDYYIISSFISGIFFTSVFTLAPASVTLVHIAETSPILGVVVWGGLGAMCGDLILFFFVRDHFADDIGKVFKPKRVKFFMKSLHFGFMRWLSPVIGALIIASPLPDEFGITLLGMSKVKTTFLMPIAFIMNMIGIYVLIAFSHLL